MYSTPTSESGSLLKNRYLQDARSFFTVALLAWDKAQNRREMPWKGEKDPYKIWVSEIILQQTRVDQGRAYYERFIESFTNIRQLAAAPEEKVFKLWEGLGYYSRCRNLIATSRILDSNYGGKFPDSYNEILKLKGIGPYTAAAIASFAFNLPHAVLDGNVFRIISRYFGIHDPIDTNGGKKYFGSLAEELLDKNNPAKYNQAIMDFGATVCKPLAPLCDTCPLKNHCIAFKENKIDQLPVKSNAISRRSRWLNYFIIHFGGQVYIRKRIEKDIWQSLHEFFLIESKFELPAEKLIKKLSLIASENRIQIVKISGTFKQKLTHQDLFGKFVELRIDKPMAGLDGFELVSFNELDRLAFPKLIISYLKEKNVNLSQD